jgi:hypothetical protein
MAASGPTAATSLSPRSCVMACDQASQESSPAPAPARARRASKEGSSPTIALAALTTTSSPVPQASSRPEALGNEEGCGHEHAGHHRVGHQEAERGARPGAVEETHGGEHRGRE